MQRIMSCNNCLKQSYCKHYSPFYPPELWDIIGGSIPTDSFTQTKIDSRAYNLPLSKDGGVLDIFHTLCPNLYFACTTLPFEPYILIDNEIGDINLIPCNAQKNTDIPFNAYNGSKFGSVIQSPNAIYVSFSPRTINGETVTDLSILYLIDAFISQYGSNTYVIPNEKDIINTIDCDSFIRIGNGETALSFTRTLSKAVLAVTDEFYNSHELLFEINGVSNGYQIPISISPFNPQTGNALWVSTLNVGNINEWMIHRLLELYYEKYTILPDYIDGFILVPVTTPNLFANPRVWINGITGEVYQDPSLNGSVIDANGNNYLVADITRIGPSVFNKPMYVYIPKRILLGTHYRLFENKTAEIIWVNRHEQEAFSSNSNFKRIPPISNVIDDIFISGYIGFNFFDAYNYRDLRLINSSPNSVRESGIPNPNPEPQGFPPNISFRNGVVDSGTLVMWYDTERFYSGQNIIYRPSYQEGGNNFSLIEYSNPNYPNILKFYRDNNYTYKDNNYFILSSTALSQPLNTNRWIYFIYPSSVVGFNTYKLEYSGQNINHLPIVPIDTTGMKSGTLVPIIYSPLFGNNITRSGLITQLNSYPQFSGIQEYWDFMDFTSYSGSDLPVDIFIDKLSELSAQYSIERYSGAYTRFASSVNNNNFSNPFESSKNAPQATWSDVVAYDILNTGSGQVEYMRFNTACTNGYPQFDYIGLRLLDGYFVDINMTSALSGAITSL